MIEKKNPSQNQQIEETKPVHIQEPILPKITKSQIVQTSSLQEITSKMISETSALVSFLSFLLERIQTHISLTNESISHLFQCLDFIPKTNFFYPPEPLKKITEVLGQLMKAVEQSIIDSNIKMAIFEKGYQINDSLIDYRLKEKYLVAFYSTDCNRNLSDAFYSDMKKLSKGNNCNLDAVNQLQLIFDIANCKMSGKHRNDIGNQLYDLRVLARTNFRKFSYQPDINKKKQMSVKVSSNHSSNSDVNSNTNTNTNANIMSENNANAFSNESKDNNKSKNIEIIQLFSQEEPKKKEKESFSFKHRYNNQVSSGREHDNLYSLESGSREKDTIQNITNAVNIDNVLMVNQQEAHNVNPNCISDFQEIISQIPLSNQLINSNINEGVSDNNKDEIKHESNVLNPREKEIEDILLSAKIKSNNNDNTQINQMTQVTTEPNRDDDILKQRPILPPQRALSEKKSQINFLNQKNEFLNYNIPPSSIVNSNQTLGMHMENHSGQEKSNSKTKNKTACNNNSKSKNQHQNQNYVNQMNINMQMANFYQNLMSIANQQQQNRTFFNQSNHQFNTSNQNLNPNVNVNINNSANSSINNTNHINQISSDQLKTEYLTLKALEHDNPTLIKGNLLKYEQFIILPIYQQLNRMINQKKHIYSDIFNKYKPIIVSVFIKNQLEKSIVQPFGSIVNNFLLDEGDVDICIVPENCSIENFSIHLNEINEAITSKHIGKCLLSHISPRYSLLKIGDTETGMTVDITVQSMLPLYNTKLIRSYSLYDQRFHIIGIYVKYWVKRNKIKGATEKYLSSYALIIMIIHFLQMEIKPSVLPILQRVSNENKPYEYTHSDKVLISNIYFEEDANKINQYMNIVNCGLDNKESVASLLLKFFEFYVYNYDHSYLLSINNSEKIPASNEHIAFPIDDPFDEEHNPGKSMKLNTSQYDTFIYCMKKEINHIMKGDIITNDFLLGY